jgi:hypothetical protein
MKNSKIIRASLIDKNLKVILNLILCGNRDRREKTFKNLQHYARKEGSRLLKIT